MCLSHLNILPSLNCYQVCEDSKLSWNSACIQKNMIWRLKWLCCSESWYKNWSSCNCHNSLQGNSLEIIFSDIFIKLNMSYLITTYSACFIHLKENMIQEWHPKYIAGSRNAEVLNNHQRTGEKSRFFGEIDSRNHYTSTFCADI